MEDKGKAFKKQASDKYLIYALPYEQSSLSSQQARETSLSCQADEGRLGLLATQPIQLSRLKKQLNKRGILSCFGSLPFFRFLASLIHCKVQSNWRNSCFQSLASVHLVP